MGLALEHNSLSVETARVFRATMGLMKFASLALAAGILMLSCSRPPGPHSHPVNCQFFPERQPAACEERSDGSVVVAEPSLAHADFGQSDLAAIYIDGRPGLYFVNRRGKTAPAFLYDNGPDYLVEGLARTVRNGKMGFVNTQLEEIVQPVWDFASPFQDGVAAVCTGCVPKAAGDEHTYMSGGKWGYIDRHGRVIVPVEYEQSRLPAAEFAARQVKR